MAAKETPKKPVKRGRVAKHAQDPSDFCRLCSCSFKIRFGNNEKATSMSSENIFKPSKKKGYISKGTLPEMCSFMGLQVEMSQRLSTRVCNSCARKIRSANENFIFIRSCLTRESSTTTPANSTTSSPERFKRSLPTTISTPERSPRQAKKPKPKSFSCPKKCFNFNAGRSNEDENDDETTESRDCALSALNIEELIERSSTQVKVVIVFPNGKVETRSSFHDGIKSTIVNLARANLKAVANIVFKLPNIQGHLLESLRRTVANEFRTYCQDSSESVLKGNTPLEVAAFSNKILVHDAELSCPFWMSCLRGACNSANFGEKEKEKVINSMALTTAIAARCRNQKMSAVAFRISTILFHSGVKFEDIKRLHKLGIFMTPESIVGMERKMGENCETKVKFWKRKIETNISSELLLNETKKKQVGLLKEDDMDVDVFVDFARHVIEKYVYCTEETYLYCNDLLEKIRGSDLLTNDHLEKAMAILLNTKLPHYK